MVGATTAEIVAIEKSTREIDSNPCPFAAAKVAGDTMAQIDRVIVNPGGLTCACHVARYPQHCWRKYELRELIRRKEHLKEQEKREWSDRVDSGVGYEYEGNGLGWSSRPTRLSEEEFVALPGLEPSAEFLRKHGTAEEKQQQKRLSEETHQRYQKRLKSGIF